MKSAGSNAVRPAMFAATVDGIAPLCSSKDMILIMCSNHHWELDNGHLLLADIPPREGQLIRTEYEYKKKR